MPINFSPFDVVDYLDSEEMIVAYLNEALGENDPDLLLGALDDVARARSKAGFASATSFTTYSQYEHLEPGAGASFIAVCQVASALGLRLMFVPKEP